MTPARPDLLYRIEHRLVSDGWPQPFRPDTLYVLTQDGEPWSVDMICPCGSCRQVLSINLRSAVPPFWSITRHSDASISLYPTVNREACGVRFVIAYGALKFRDARPA